MDKIETLDVESSAARKIQASWRNYRESKSRRIPSPKETNYTDEQYLSALIIQSFYRDYIAGKRLRREQEDAARLIQYHYRQYLRKSEEEFEADLERAAKSAQESYNKLQSENEPANRESTLNSEIDFPAEQGENEDILSSDHDKQIEAATLIQRKYREHLEAQKEENSNKASITIKIDDVSYFDNEKINVDLNSENNAAATDVKKPCIASDEDPNFSEQEGIELNDEVMQNNAATLIQRRYRKRQQEKLLLEKRNKAAICIQRQYRKYAENSTIETSMDNKVAGSLQKETAHDNSDIENKDLPESSIKSSDDEYIPEVAAMTIQKHYKNHYNKRVSAATLIQHQYRSYKSSPRTKNEISPLPNENTSLEKEAKAATVIQRQYRAHLLAMSGRDYDLPTESPDILKLADERIENVGYHGNFVDTTPENYIMHLNLNDDYEGEQYESPINGNALVGYDDSKLIGDNVSFTTDGKSEDDGFIDWNKSLSRRNRNKLFPDAPSPKYSKGPVSSKKPGPKFDKQWPESKKSQHQKIKESPRKKQVQVSLEIKREQRRNEKNQKKDKFHLSNLRKQAPNPKFTESTSKKLTNGQRNVKKSDTPQLKEKHKTFYPPPEPELLELLDSAGEEEILSPITLQSSEIQDTSPESRRKSDETKSSTMTQININKNKKPNDNINLEHSRSTHVNKTRRNGAEQVRDMRMARHRSEPAQDARSGRIARRLSDQSSLSSTTHNLSVQNKVAKLGSLDSYAVQNLLKRNDMLTRQFVFQRNDNHSYLQSYLKQMNLMNRPSAPVVSNQHPITNERQGWSRKSYTELVPGNLEKIAKYGRNSHADTWKSIASHSPREVSEPKGASRGGYYPVLPAYGKMKQNTVNSVNTVNTVNQSSQKLNEIPWPRDIG